MGAPNNSPEPAAVGAGRSAVAVHVISRRWLSFFRSAAKPITVLVPLMLAAVIYAGCATTKPNGDTAWEGFPESPPIPDVDPSIRHELVVRVPTRLTIEHGTNMHGTNMVWIMGDRHSLEATNIMVGSKTVTGVQSQLFVYPEGDARPPGRVGLSGPLDFKSGSAIVNPKQVLTPAPAKGYMVEMDLAIFETDIPPQHMWSPYSKNYKILWKRTFRPLAE